MALAPQDRAWSILLRELPQYLARPTERQPHDQGMYGYYGVWRRTADGEYHALEEQARDLLAMVLVRKPRAPDATANHKDAKILLLRMALTRAWAAGREVIYDVREMYMGRHYRRLDMHRVFAHPRPSWRTRKRDHEVFHPIRDFGETEEDALRQYVSAVGTAENNRARRRRL